MAADMDYSNMEGNTWALLGLITVLEYLIA